MNPENEWAFVRQAMGDVDQLKASGEAIAEKASGLHHYSVESISPRAPTLETKLFEIACLAKHVLEVIDRLHRFTGARNESANRLS